MINRSEVIMGVAAAGFGTLPDETLRARIAGDVPG